MKIEGTVVHGKHVGRTIGFPTANVDARRRTGSGPDGVYAALVHVDGRRHFAMVNIGRHPTLPEGAPTVEAHIFDFADDIYGRQVCIETAGFIRPERKFDSIEALRKQLEQDKIAARQLLAAKTQETPGIE